jgi:transcriptional regulator with XRE-family HTH domain
MPRAPRPSELIREAGERLRLAREALGLQAKDVCDAINVRPNTYSQWENGTNLADVTAMVRFRDRWGIPLDWIYADDMAMVPNHVAQKIKELRADGSAEPAARQRKTRRAAASGAEPAPQKKRAAAVAPSPEADPFTGSSEAGLWLS